jgi:hypothetical protein
LQSSIAYSKSWDGKYNLSLNLNHNQNNNTKLVNMSLPTGTFSVVTFYPFQKRKPLEPQNGTKNWVLVITEIFKIEFHFTILHLVQEDC